MREAFKGDRHRPSGKLTRARSCARSRRSSSTSRASTCCSSCRRARRARARTRPRALLAPAARAEHKPPPPRGTPQRARPPAQLSDTNGDDEIDFDEFVAGLKERPPALARARSRATMPRLEPPRTPPASAPQQFDLSDAMKRFQAALVARRAAASRAARRR